jgi:hypothetical protein
MASIHLALFYKFNPLSMFLDKSLINRAIGAPSITSWSIRIDILSISLIAMSLVVFPDFLSAIGNIEFNQAGNMMLLLPYFANVDAGDPRIWEFLYFIIFQICRFFSIFKTQSYNLLMGKAFSFDR